MRRRDQALVERWLDRIARQASSDVSVSAFCRRERVSAQSFYRWKRILRASGRRPAPVLIHPADTRDQPRPAFVPITVAPDAAAIEIELPNTACVRVPAASDPDLVCRLVALASGLPRQQGTEVAPC